MADVHIAYTAFYIQSVSGNYLWRNCATHIEGDQ